MAYEQLSPKVWARARRQAERSPAIYGRIDFDRMPERFTVSPTAECSLRGPLEKHRAEILANEARVAMVAGYTMVGEFLFSRVKLYDAALRMPVARDIADRLLVATLNRRLASYGHADFVSDGDAYRPAHAGG